MYLIFVQYINHHIPDSWLYWLFYEIVINIFTFDGMTLNMCNSDKPTMKDVQCSLQKDTD